MGADLAVWQLGLLAVAGLVAGFINGTVGGGSLLTYPLLVAMGLPPVISAATNSTGLSLGNGAALIPHRGGETVAFRAWRVHAIFTAAGALLGGSLLILLPERVFEFLVPLLLVFASLTMVIKPRRHAADPARPAHTLGRLFGAGIYNGYFGPGQGVLAMAVLLADGRLDVRQTVVIKNLVLATSNIVVAVLFISTGHVFWSAALMLLWSTAVGAWLGGRAGKSLNATLTRWSVAIIGFASAGWFVLGR